MSLVGRPLTRTLVLLLAASALLFACDKKKKAAGDKSSGGKKQEETPTDAGDPPGGDPCSGVGLLDGLSTDDDEVTLDPGGEEGDEEVDVEIDSEEPFSDSTSVSGCDPGGDSDGGEPPSGGGGGSWNPGPGIDGCEAQGKAWIAVTSGGPGSCGDPLVTDWCCTTDEVKARFPSLASQIQTALDDPAKGGGMTLYHCSQAGGKYQFHMAKATDNGGAKYYTFYFAATPVDTGNGAQNCPKVTMADLGFDLSGADGGNEDAGEDDGGIPDEIPGLDDLSAEGLKGFLEDEKYAGWTKEAGVRKATVGPHPYVKLFFNGALKASIEEGNDEHPVGAIVVKELYEEDKTTRTGWALMAKIKEGKDASSWLFYDFHDGEQKAFGAGAADCANCHKTNSAAGSKDFVISRLPE